MSASAVAAVPSPATTCIGCRHQGKCVPPAASKFTSGQLRPRGHRHHNRFPLQVANESRRTEVSMDSSSERSEADRIVDGMDFGELCNEFECISSPLVESTARQLVRDVLELREGNRALGTYAVSVKYKDPVRSFRGREKYKRPLWVNGALENPSVSVQEMVMLSTSVLRIKWTIRGRPKSVIAAIGGDLIVRVNSQFNLNQISGQVIEHKESWDLSASSLVAQAFFWASRGLFATVEAGKDLTESVKNLGSRFTTEKENLQMYPDPSGDPTKKTFLSDLSRNIYISNSAYMFGTRIQQASFFQRDNGLQQDLYQIALLLAVLYFVVQFLRTIL